MKGLTLEVCCSGHMKCHHGSGTVSQQEADRTGVGFQSTLKSRKQLAKCTQARWQSAHPQSPEILCLEEGCHISETAVLSAKSEHKG